jgi:hypothetical protein
LKPQVPSAAACQVREKDQKKAADKQRKLMEKALRLKADALRDDDNVFDVAYEQRGAGEGDVVSATDIKVLYIVSAGGGWHSVKPFLLALWF